MAYTPFLTKAGAAIGKGLETRGLKQQQAIQNRLAGSAYMGDPQAMEELMQVNPQLGMKIQEQAQKRKASAQQQQLQKRAAFKKEQDDFVENVGKFDTYEEAKAYADPIIDDFLQRFPELASKMGSGLSREGYEQARQLGEKPSASEKKKQELMDMGYSEDISTGIGYNTYRQITDDEGNIRIYDLRGQPLSPDDAAGLPTEARIIAKGTKKEVRKEKQVIASQVKIDKELQGIKDDLVGQGDIGGLDSSLAEVERLIKDIGKGDIPGFGITAIAPDILISQEGKDLRGAVASVFNRMLKLRSGAAVTDPELRRLMVEFGKGNIKSDEQLRVGLQKARKHLNRAISNIAAGYSMEAVKKWDDKASTLGNTLIGNRFPDEISAKRKRLEELRAKQ